MTNDPEFSLSCYSNDSSVFSKENQEQDNYDKRNDVDHNS